MAIRIGNKRVTGKAGVIIMCLMIMAFGTIFALVGSEVFSYKGESNWKEATAEIIGFETKSKSNAAIIQFEAIDPATKETKIYKITTGYSSNQFHVGDKIFTVRYNPDNPNQNVVLAPKMFTVTFLASGCAIAGGAAIALVSFTVVNLVKKNKGKNVAISFKPSSMFEYKALDDSNKLLYRFKRNKADPNNYIVEDKEGKKVYTTTSSGENSYRLLNDNVEIKRVLGSNEDLSLKVNNKGLKQFFYERHVTFEVEEKDNELVYTMFNNLTKIAELHEIEHNGERLFIIITAKENIDDAALFALCVAKRKGFDF